MQGYLIFIIEQLEENTNPLWRISYSKQIDLTEEREVSKTRRDLCMTESLAKMLLE